MAKRNARLIDLGPSFYGAGGDGITRDGKPVPKRSGVGLMCRCPCGDHSENHWMALDFENPLDGGPRLDSAGPWWKRTGDTFETLSLMPSVLRNPTKGGCGWHGFLTDGEFKEC